MKNSDERQSKNRRFEIMFWKRALHKYAYIYIYIYVHAFICERLFSKTQSMNLALTWKAFFWNGLLHLRKELFIYVYCKESSLINLIA